MSKISYHSFLFGFALYLTLFCNRYFFSLIAPHSSSLEIFWIGTLLCLLLAFALEILCLRWSAKFICFILIILSASNSYTINILRTGITPDLVHSILNANPREIKETLNSSFILHFLTLSIIPLIGLFYFKFKPTNFWKGLKQKSILLLLYATLILGLWFEIIGKKTTFLFKQDRTLYYVINPISPIRSKIQFLQEQSKRNMTFTQVGLDVKRTLHQKPKIVVLILGESARSQNFSLNGYAKNTNPYTSKQSNLISFKSFYSCGVITAISVPCMLTDYTQETYTKRYLSDYKDNILDIAQRAGITTYYIGNNGGGCIGNICVRLPKDQVKFYNDGNLDEVMLKDLDEILQTSASDKFIVLHQMGSHGQAYFERYPKSFAIFNPTCDTAQIQNCSIQALMNTYDNSLIYTDFFIHSAIERLKKIQDQFEVALWYISDHGESLGENGMYMHGGLPYFLAPQTQTKIPSILWLGKGYDLRTLKTKENQTLNQDYVFHTLFTLLGIQSQVYNPSLDLFQPQRES